MHFWAVSRLDSCAQKTQYAHKYSRFFQKFVDWNWVSWIIYCFAIDTGKSLSEALIFSSTNPQYDNRLFIELPVQYMKIPSSEHGENIGRTWVEHVVHISCSECQNKNKKQFLYTQHVLLMFSSCSPHVLSLEFSCTELVIPMDNLLSYCGLVDALISTSEKDLPVFSIYRTKRYIFWLFSKFVKYS